MQAGQGDWHLEGDASRWRLHFRCRLGRLQYAPSNLPPAARWYFWIAVAILPLVVTAAFAAAHIQFAAALLVFALADAWLLAVWFLPNRMSGILGMSYSQAVGARSVDFEHGKFDVPAGVFEDALLSTLRVAPIEWPRGNAVLLFDGHFDTDLAFVDWPGFPADVATTIKAAVLERVRPDDRAGES